MKRRRITALLLIATMALASAGCSSSTESTTASSIDATDASSAVVDAVANVASSMESETAETTASTYADLTHEDVYGSQFPAFIDHQYYFDGEPVSLSESNFYLVNSFSEFTTYAQYGYYPATYDGFLDLAAVPETAEGVDIEYATYGDFLVDYTDQVLHSTLIICKFCEEEGITLDDETVAEINSMVDSLEESQATPNGVTLDEYIRLFYGDGATVEGIKQALYNYYLADYYTNEYINNYELTEEDKASAAPVVRYALYYAPEGSDEATLASAEALANDVLAQCNGDIEAFPSIGTASQTAGDCLEYGELTVTRGQFVEEFENWAWDEARTEGDLDVIYTTSYGYFVVGFVGRDKTDVAISALGDYVSSLFDVDGYLLEREDYAPAVAVEAPETEATAVASTAQDTASTSILSAEDLANVGSTEASGNSTGKVALIILASVGGAAILGLAGVGAASIFKNNKVNKEVISKAYEESSKDFDASDDNDGEAEKTEKASDDSEEE